LRGGGGGGGGGNAVPRSANDYVFTSSGNAQGTVDENGVCSCAVFYHGDGCESQYTDAITCNGAGTVDATGTCTCTGGFGVRCYNDAVTCTWILTPTQARIGPSSAALRRTACCLMRVVCCSSVACVLLVQGANACFRSVGGVSHLQATHMGPPTWKERVVAL